ncbi:hypothetical protein LLG95_08050 [bacterium]|nr:hypothetical protein [bacterium]
MKNLIVAMIAACALGLFGCRAATTEHAISAKPATTAARRIGVYDSRSVAVAFAGSAKHEARTASELTALKQAKASGDQVKIAEADKRVWDSRKRLHRQGFGTAPVNDILELYPDEVRALKARRGIDALVSKWDAKALAQYAGAEQLDVTDEMIEIPQPREKQRRSAQEIRKSKPLSEAQVERVIKQETGH